MKKLIYPLSIILLLTNSQCSPTTNSDLNGFGSEIPLSHRILNPSLIIQMPEPPFIVDSNLYILSPGIRRGTFGKVISLKTFQEDGSFGTIGKGPKEVLWSTPMFYADYNKPVNGFETYDLPSRSVAEFGISRENHDSIRVELVRKRAIPRHTSQPEDNVRVCRIGTDNYMGLCFHAQDQFFTLMDSNLNFLRYFGTAPIPEQASNYPDRLNGHLEASYGIAVYAPLYLPYIACYQMDSIGLPTKLWEDTFGNLHYTIQNGQFNFNMKEAKGATRNLVIGRKYIYLLWYDGLLDDYHRYGTTTEADPNLVLVYNHQGWRVGQMRLDTRICRIAVSDDERTLYGLMQPEYALVSFDLPEKYPAN